VLSAKFVLHVVWVGYLRFCFQKLLVYCRGGNQETVNKLRDFGGNHNAFNSVAKNNFLSLKVISYLYDTRKAHLLVYECVF
jgi:hypothetical protein